jgi:hypothetical protein
VCGVVRSGHALKLDAIETGIQAVEREEFVMRSLLDYTAIVKYENSICVADRAETMGDRNDCPSRHHLIERPHVPPAIRRGGQRGVNRVTDGPHAIGNPPTDMRGLGGAGD